MIRTLLSFILLAGHAAAFATPVMVEGEIRKVDKDAAKLTIKHAELPNLSMPPMTMVFRVKDKAMLGQVAAGDKVHFAADKVGGVLTVTALEKAVK
ncbi:MAG: copper-binding protein [Pseudomonadota bacterium]